MNCYDLHFTKLSEKEPNLGLIERLEFMSTRMNGFIIGIEVCQEAANEIKQLRNRIKAQRE